MKNTNIFDKDINPVLEISSNEDLEILVRYIEGKFSEKLTRQEVYKQNKPNHTEYADLIAKEIRDMGGNSFANIARGGEGPSYHEIVCNVAAKLKAPYNDSRDVAHIEDSILETILSETLEKMTDKEKEQLLVDMGMKASLGRGAFAAATFIAIFRQGGFYSYQLALVIANYIARFILGQGLMLAANASITRAFSVITGPLGIAITGLWAAIDVAGPAYKVTIPCVVHIAMLRKKMNSIQCSNCEAILPDFTMKFCPECGHKI